MRTFSAALVTLVLGGTALAAPQAALASTNLALAADGASFVSGSSVIPQGTFGLTIDYAVMQDNLLTDTPGASISNGDTRYIFGGFDADGTVEIDLGQIRQISSIGANIDLPTQGDRFVLGPFTATVSTNGMAFSSFGSPVSSVTVNGSTVNPVTLFAPAESVRFVRYSFGPANAVFGANNGGSAIFQVFANGAVPEPASWALMITGFGLAGATLRRRRAPAAA